MPYTLELGTSGTRICTYSLNIHYSTYLINDMNTVLDIAVSVQCASLTHCCWRWLNFHYQGSQQRHTAC